MLTKIRLTGIALFLMTFISSCVKDGVDECPTGEVRLDFYAEKFRNKFEDPLADREAKFCDIIKHVRYYLYKDGELYQQQIVSEFNDTEESCFTLTFNNLEYGDYQIVAVGNSTRTALSGDPTNPSNLLITYSGCSDTEDYFTTSFAFKVDDPGLKKYDVGMSRVHGVIRYTFRNMPDDVVAFEVAMENVASQRWILGDYVENARAFNRFTYTAPVASQIKTRQEMTDNDFIIGTFPTLANQRAAYHLSLYRDGQENPYIAEMISDTLSVARNQLLDITTIFEDGDIRFEINMDSQWNGSVPGGNTGLE